MEISAQFGSIDDVFTRNWSIRRLDYITNSGNSAGAAYLSTVVPEHVGTFIGFIENLFASQVIPFYNRIASILQSLDSGQQDTIMNSINDTGNKITESATAFLQNFFLKLPSLVTWIPNAATVIVFSLLATFFISKDWDQLTALSMLELAGLATLMRERVDAADIRAEGLRFRPAPDLLLVACRRLGVQPGGGRHLHAQRGRAATAGACRRARRHRRRRRTAAELLHGFGAEQVVSSLSALLDLQLSDSRNSLAGSAL